MNKIMLTFSASVLAAIILATTAFAGGRPATTAERAQIANLLRANGYTSWKKIEFNMRDHKFEAYEARHVSGRVETLDIRGDRIVKRKPE